MAKIQPSFAGATLARLCHYRWALPVVAQLHVERGAKFVTLVNRLSVGRDSLTRTLRGLGELGLVQRNEGYGHPMRPEYVLTEKGRGIGDDCRRLVQLLEKEELLKIGLRKWSLPIVHTLAAEPARFSALSQQLQGSTPRAVTGTLKTLCSHHLIDRRLVDEYPPVSLYGVSQRGMPLIQPLAAVAGRLGAMRGAR